MKRLAITVVVLVLFFLYSRIWKNDPVDSSKNIVKIKNIRLLDEKRKATRRSEDQFSNVSKLETIDIVEQNSPVSSEVVLSWLKKLSVQGNKKVSVFIDSKYISSERIKELGEDDLNRINKLFLYSKKISDLDLKNLERLTSLSSLSLWGTSITDEGLKLLSKVISLSLLDLGDTGVTDKGLRHLTNMSSLTVLNLKSTTVTKHGAKEFQRYIPNCKIQR